MRKKEYVSKTIISNSDNSGAESVSEMIENRMRTEETKSGRKRFVCSICSQAGPMRTVIMVHIEGHLNIKNSCKVCSETFSTRSDLKLHMFNTHQ